MLTARGATVDDMAIARFPSIVLDCPDPEILARFYGALLDWKVEASPTWGEVRADYGQCICFQPVQDYTPPVWPGQQVPQQMHIDVMVEDLDVGEFGIAVRMAQPEPGEAAAAQPSAPSPQVESGATMIYKPAAQPETQAASPAELGLEQRDLAAA